MPNLFYHTSFRYLILVTVAFSSSSIADDSSSQKLSLESIYGSNRVSSKSFSGTWAPTGSSYTLSVDAVNKLGNDKKSAKDIVTVDARTGKQTTLVNSADLIPEGATHSLSVAAFEFSHDRSHVLIFTNTKRVWRRNTRGDYWVRNNNSGKLIKLGSRFDEASLMFAKFSPDGTSVAYVHDGDIYIEKLTDNTITQVTKKKGPNVINGTSDWVNEEELSIRDGFRFSPDGTMIAYWQFDTTDVPVMTMIDNTAAKYPTLIRFPYPKAGQKNSICRIGVANLQTKQTRWADLPGDPRQHYVARIDWAPLAKEASAELVIQHFNRLQNTNRIFAWSPKADQPREVLVEKDEAWVDVHDEMFWLSNATQFTWATEQDGWRRICIVDYATGKRTIITPAGVDAIELVAVNENQKLAYVLSSPDNATQRYLYKVSFDGSGWTRISPADQAGTHSYRVSADGSLALHTFSSLLIPPTTNLISLPDHKLIRELESNSALAAFVANNCKASVTFSKVEIEDGVELDSWTIQPSKILPNQKYPLLVYVYGEPAGTTVNDRWMGSTYLWYQLLAQRGYVVKSFDNRGTPAPKGRAWRKSVYRKVGINAPKDQAAAVRKVLASHPHIDADRVGVWGWSGGGSMTLNAMFRYPDLYSTGISIAPVPDQLGYDTIYQERYMGLPDDNPDGYRDGSAIHICDQLKGKLLLIHGTGDDNCHYATMEQLIDKLIEHNKPFDMMSYPNRTHSIKEGKNTTLHLRTLMTEYLKKNLPAGPRG